MLSFDGRFKSGRSAQGLVRKTLFVNQILKIHTSLITSRAFYLLFFFVISLVLASMTSLLVRFIMIMMLSSNLSVLEL